VRLDSSGLLFFVVDSLSRHPVYCISYAIQHLNTVQLVQSNT
jgi:hypothetical protein